MAKNLEKFYSNKTKTMEEEKINPGHSSVRTALRVIGPILAVVGLIFIVAGLVGFFSAFGRMGPPKNAWCPFVGMPLLFVGIVLTSYGFMGKVARYQAGEIAPVAKDTFNYVAKGSSPGIQAAAVAIGQGLRQGAAGEDTDRFQCPNCSSPQDSDAKFCDDCGTPIQTEKTCPKCNEPNDHDAKFCDNCGQEL